MNAEMSLRGASAPPLVVRAEGTDRSLPAGPSYLVGRDPECDIVIADPRVSWQHAVISLENGHWVLSDNRSTNGTYAEGRRVDQIEITGTCLARLGDPTDGPVLSCTVGDVVPTGRHGAEVTSPVGGDGAAKPAPPRGAGPPLAAFPMVVTASALECAGCHNHELIKDMTARRRWPLVCLRSVMPEGSLEVNAPRG